MPPIEPPFPFASCVSQYLNLEKFYTSVSSVVKSKNTIKLSVTRPVLPYGGEGTLKAIKTQALGIFSLLTSYARAGKSALHYLHEEYKTV
jgi:hypothetical protein